MKRMPVRWPHRRWFALLARCAFAGQFGRADLSWRQRGQLKPIGEYMQQVLYHASIHQKTTLCACAGVSNRARSSHSS